MKKKSEKMKKTVVRLLVTPAGSMLPVSVREWELDPRKPQVLNTLREFCAAMNLGAKALTK